MPPILRGLQLSCLYINSNFFQHATLHGLGCYEKLLQNFVICILDFADISIEIGVSTFNLWLV